MFSRQLFRGSCSYAVSLRSICYKSRPLCSTGGDGDFSDEDLLLKKPKKVPQSDFVKKGRDEVKQKRLNIRARQQMLKKSLELLNEIKEPKESTAKAEGHHSTSTPSKAETKKKRVKPKVHSESSGSEKAAAPSPSIVIEETLKEMKSSGLSQSEFVKIFEESFVGEESSFVNTFNDDGKDSGAETVSPVQDGEENDIISPNTVKKNVFEGTFDASKKQKLFEQIDVRLKGYDVEVMASYLQFIKMVCEHLDLETSQIRYETRHYFRNDSLRSRFAFKDYRVQYEVRTYKRGLTFYRLTEQSANALFAYLQYNLPEGIAMELDHKFVEPLPKYLVN